MKKLFMFLVLFVWVTTTLAESKFVIHKWHTKADFEPTEQILIQNKAAGRLQKALPSNIEDDVFYLRVKEGQNLHSFYEGYPEDDFFQKAYAFKIPKGTHSQWVRTKFYRATRSKAFRDEDEVYFDQNFIYSAYVPTLFYKKDGKWESLSATKSKPGVLLIQTEPSGTEIYHKGKQIATSPFKTKGYESGVLTLTLRDSGYLPETHLFKIIPGQVNSVNVKMAKFVPNVQPTLSTQTYTVPEDDLVGPYYDQLTALNKELLDLLNQMKTLKIEFDSSYGSTPLPAPKEIDEWQNMEYIRYKEEYVATRKLAFTTFSEKFNDRVAYLTKTRVTIKSKIDEIENRLDSTSIRPAAVKWKILDSAKAQYGFKFKFQSTNGKHDFVYQATSQLTAEQEKTLLPLLQANDTTHLQYQTKFQNKLARIPNKDKILPRYYRYNKVQIIHDGLPVALIGNFKLPPYVASFSEVDAWLNADKIAAAQRLENEKEQAKLLAQKRREIEAAQYQELLEQLRGSVVELDSGFFKYNRKKVFISSFAVNATEVTQEHYQRLMGKNPSKFKNPKKPVHNVDFDSALKFCKTAGGDLPTEAQWEYSARAGTNSYFFWGDRSKDAEPYTVYDHNSLDEGVHSPAYGPQIVGSKRPNPWGLYDVAGNVKEWTKDYDGLFAIILYTKSRNPTGLANPIGMWHERIFKGGSWRDEKKLLEHRKDDYEDPRYWGDMLGFRCVYPSNQVVKKEDILKKINKYKKKLEKKAKTLETQAKKDTLDTTRPKVTEPAKPAVDKEPEILDKKSTTAPLPATQQPKAKPETNALEKAKTPVVAPTKAPSIGPKVTPTTQPASTPKPIKATPSAAVKPEVKSPTPAPVKAESPTKVSPTPQVEPKTKEVKSIKETAPKAK